MNVKRSTSLQSSNAVQNAYALALLKRVQPKNRPIVEAVINLLLFLDGDRTVSREAAIQGVFELVRLAIRGLKARSRG